MAAFKILDKIECSDDHLDGLLRSIRDKTIECSNHVIVNGDNRFWNVSHAGSEIVDAFRSLAISCYSAEFGCSPKHVIIMANHISAESCPAGSGGGWHIDSFVNQYKLFMYLTDCLDARHGPLTLFSSGKYLKDKIEIFKNYLTNNKFRFADRRVEQLRGRGFSESEVLLSKLTPFFVNTSSIHRGAPISYGERIMLTAYLFNKIPPSIQKRIVK